MRGGQRPFQGAGVYELIMLLGRASATESAEFPNIRPVQLEG